MVESMSNLRENSKNVKLGGFQVDKEMEGLFLTSRKLNIYIYIYIYWENSRNIGEYVKF